MSSVKSKIFNLILQHRYLFQGKLKKERFDDNTSIEAFRKLCEDGELYEDGEKFYLKAKKAVVDVTFRSGKNMIHCYPLLAPMFREATEALEEICMFIKNSISEKIDKTV